MLEDLVKAGALHLAYGIVFSGCLRDAAQAFDDLAEDLTPRAAKELWAILGAIAECRIGARFENSGAQADKEAHRCTAH